MGNRAANWLPECQLDRITHLVEKCAVGRPKNFARRSQQLGWCGLLDGHIVYGTSSNVWARSRLTEMKASLQETKTASARRSGICGTSIQMRKRSWSWTSSSRKSHPLLQRWIKSLGCICPTGPSASGLTKKGFYHPWYTYSSPIGQSSYARWQKSS